MPHFPLQVDVLDSKALGFGSQCQHGLADGMYAVLLQIYPGQSAIATLTGLNKAIKCVIGQETAMGGLYNVEKADRQNR
jgi:hypothetical protein